MIKQVKNIFFRHPLAIIVTGVFLVLLLPQVFQQGLFFDGLTYSSVANNLAIGRGTPWDPMYSEVVYRHFYEHPPLMFWLEGILMRIFDGAFYVEKVFGFICAIFTGFLIVGIFRKFNDGNKNRSVFWLPLLLWVTTPKVFWSYNNNMLENLLSVFVLASTFFFIKVLKDESKWKSLALGSAFLFLGFLTKGLVALFPLAVFILYALVFERNRAKILKRFMETVYAILIFSLILGAMFIIIPGSFDFFKSYFDVQVLSSIEGKRRTGVRLMLLYDLFMELIPMLSFMVLSLLILFKYRMERIPVKQVLWYLLIGLSATIPLLISPKLSAFYLVPAFPFYALALSAMLSPYFRVVHSKLNGNPTMRKALGGIGLFIIMVAIVWTIVQAGTYYRDKAVISDVQKVAAVNKEKEIMSISHALKNDWTTMAYFQRFHQISFDIHTDTLQYILLLKEESVPLGYSNVPLDLEKLKLVKKNNYDR